jgi:quercetin dioxygenase-like cupin family protein
MNEKKVTGPETDRYLLGDRTVVVVDAPWNPHPAFPGVFLRNLVLGRDTGGTISVHMVRVEPGSRLDAHVHEGQWEMHRVTAGDGAAVIDGREAEYRPGVAAVIPKGSRHEVTAASGAHAHCGVYPALM